MERRSYGMRQLGPDMTRPAKAPDGTAKKGAAKALDRLAILRAAKAEELLALIAMAKCGLERPCNGKAEKNKVLQRQGNSVACFGIAQTRCGLISGAMELP